MPAPCIFRDHDSGSPEHLWPDWMHNTVKFAPVNMQEVDGPTTTDQDPERTIATVFHDCNTGWMSLIENNASTRLKQDHFRVSAPVFDSRYESHHPQGI